MKMNRIIAGALLSLFCSSALHAKITLPAVLADNMVLQQNTQVNLWGKASPDKKVIITPAWSKKSFETKADHEGNWKTSIPTPLAGGPWEITISDGSAVTLKNILVGEVWLCSGQSNMEMPMRGFPSQPIEGSMDILTKADPKTPIRSFTVKRKIATIPENDCTGEWSLHTPQGVAETSATAYFFARYLQETLNVPVGIIIASWGGTKIEPWMTPDELRNFPHTDLSHLGSKTGTDNHQAGSVLYNGMLMPVSNHTIKGAIWYQGESNKDNAPLYEQLLPAFVKGLRATWKQGDFPFYYTQIAPYVYDGPNAVSSALLREAQLKCMNTIPNSGMAVTMDIGDPRCIHPRKKKEVGERLAYWALAKDYNKPLLAYQGPSFKEMSVENGKAIMLFDHIPYGIDAVGVNLESFEIAGEDKKFYPAKARWDHLKRKLEVSSDSVATPAAVRYGFKNCPAASVFNTFGLPASSFRTDNW